MEKKKSGIRGIKSNKKLRKLMAWYYFRARMYEKIRPFGYGFKKIAWVTSGAPVELLLSFNVLPVYPENHGAIIGAQKLGPEFSGYAENIGYSRDLCSYFRCDVGQAVRDDSPVYREHALPPFIRFFAATKIRGGLPKPDFLLCCNNICGTVLKWYEIQARFFQVPLIFLDTPYNYEGKIISIIEYVKEQIQEMIPELEKITGKKFNIEKFREICRLSQMSITLWNDVLSCCVHKPAPMTCFDAFFYLAPIVTLRGTKDVIDYYLFLKKELDFLIREKLSPVGEERFRLVWDNIPIWYKMSRLSRTFAKYGATLVGDTYTNAWAESGMNVSNPLESMAEAYATIFLNRNIEDRIESLVKLIRKYDADGFVMHSNRSCKPYSLGQLLIREQVTKRTGVQGLIIEADMTDTRAYAEEQVETRIQAFMELLE